MLNSIFILIVGFLFLIKGADFFVDGASSIAKRLHIPSLVIGLTIVAFGTSAPELAVSITAAAKGSNDIAIGNVVGSNLFNLLVVIGMSAMISPLHVQPSMIKKDYPLSILAAVALGVLSLDQIFRGSSQMTLGRMDGVMLLLGFAVFMVFAVRDAFKGRGEFAEDGEIEIKYSLPMGIFACVVGIAGIVVGGQLTIDAAKEIARSFGMSEALIGLTIVAFGTSLPELVTSIVAARKGESDIALGNVVGSNIFNIFLILGLSSTILPMTVTNSYIYDMSILIIVSVLVYLPIAKNQKIGRALGASMLATYLAYTAFLILR